MLLGFALALGAAQANAAPASPYRLSPEVAGQSLQLRAPYQMDDRYRLTKPQDLRPYAPQIASAARASGLDPELVHAVIAVESAYRPHAVSSKGAIGLMQLLPETAQSHGVNNPAEISANLRAGTHHLSGLLERFDNRLDLALAAYNAGEGAVRRYRNSIPPYAETRNYVPAVIARYQAKSTHNAAKNAAKSEARVYLPGTRLDPKALQQMR